MGIEINKKAVAIILAIGALMFYFGSGLFYKRQEKDILTPQSSFSGNGGIMMHSTWKTKDFIDIPQDVIQRMANVKVDESRIQFSFENKEDEIFYRFAGLDNTEATGEWLLLHGAAFSSNNWQTIGTIQLLAACNQKVIAVDLPGKGNSASAHAVGDKDKFLQSLIKQLNLDRPIIVSPSMSGSYSLPYLLSDPVTCRQRARGFVPVAPAGTDNYKDEDYQKCDVPTFIIYGSKDVSLGETSRSHLKNFANQEIEVIPDATHPAYIDKPEQWHKLIYNFLMAVENDQE